MRKKVKKKALALNLASETKSTLQKGFKELEWNFLDIPCAQAHGEFMFPDADLVVTDLEMSDMDESDFLKCLRSKLKSNDKPIVAFSERITPRLLAKFMVDPRAWIADKSSPAKEIKEVIKLSSKAGNRPTAIPA